MTVVGYFIEGPKHGDRDMLPEAHHEIAVPVATAYVDRWVDYGHYEAKAYPTPPLHRVGIYRRDMELHGHRMAPGVSRHKCVLYIWQGLR
jgi:hypothetical protein